jgi:hypothetical protein
MIHRAHRAQRHRYYRARLSIKHCALLCMTAHPSSNQQGARVYRVQGWCRVQGVGVQVLGAGNWAKEPQAKLPITGVRAVGSTAEVTACLCKKVDQGQSHRAVFLLWMQDTSHSPERPDPSDCMLSPTDSKNRPPGRSMRVSSLVSHDMRTCPGSLEAYPKLLRSMNGDKRWGCLFSLEMPFGRKMHCFPTYFGRWANREIFSRPPVMLL